MNAQQWSDFRRSRMTRVTLIGLVIYIMIGKAFAVGPIMEVARVLQMSLSGVVVVAYMGTASQCFFYVDRWPPRHNTVALGIVLSWLSIFTNGVWILLWRLAKQPPWMLNNDWYNLWVTVNCFAAVLHIYAPNLLGDNVRRIDKTKLLAAWAITVAVMVSVLAIRPDVSFIVDAIEPLISEPQWSFDSSRLERCEAPPRS